MARRRREPASLPAHDRHCEERSDEAIQSRALGSGLRRFARNDESFAARMSAAISGVTRHAAMNPDVAALIRAAAESRGDIRASRYTVSPQRSTGPSGQGRPSSSATMPPR
ncbi:MAG: hypothetical protein EKK32_32655 [Bradyrhizobiaceae bacterium]|nr:MAG: hypothetical protein EKK32_32655 [Bradyrhizobiaceae bacterium]